MTDAPRTLIEELTRRANTKRAEDRRAQHIRPAPFFAAAQKAQRAPAWALEASKGSLDWWPEGTQPGEVGGASHLEEVYEQVFKEARQDGYAAGLAQGAEEGRAQTVEDAKGDIEELRAVTAALTETAAQLADLRAEAMRTAGDDTLTLALEVGRRLAAEAQLGSIEWVAPLLREAVQVLTDADRVVCLVSPELEQRLGETADLGVEVPFEVRDGLGPLDIVVESSFGRVDASFKQRFDNLVTSVADATGASLTTDFWMTDTSNGCRS